MTTPSLAALLITETKERILSRGLTIAQMLGVPVTSWQTGDPTGSLYVFLSEVIETLEIQASNYINSRFLDLAAADPTLYPWLVVHAKDSYDYDATLATRAACTYTLRNAGGGLYPIEPGELTVKNSTTGKTYHNTTGGLLASGPGTTLTIDIEADEAGSESSAGAGDIDEMVVTLLEVTGSNDTAAIGLDAEPALSIVAGCRAKLGMLSPNGPRDAYVYVATRPELTGTTEVTKARSYGDSTTGRVSILVAGPSGAVSGPAVAMVQSAIEQWATPLTITPTVASADSSTIAITLSVWAYASWGVTAAEAETAIENALASWFAARPISGDIIPPAATGYVYRNMLEAVVKSTHPAIFKVAITSPAGDTSIPIDHLPVLGTVTWTVPPIFVADP